MAIACGCAKAPVPKPPLRVVLNVWSGFAYVYIAQEKGFFNQNGVVVDLVLKKDYSEAKQLYTDGGADVFFGPYSDAIYSDIEGVPTRVLWVFDYSLSADSIIGKAEYGSLSDLKGKRVGFEGINSFSHFFVLRALLKAGLSESEVRFYNVSGESALAALDGDLVDAVHTWEPMLSTALQKGYKVLATAGDIPGTITDVLACTEHVLLERPADIQAMVRSLAQARDFLRENAEEAIAIMAAAESMDVQVMAAGIDGVNLLTLEQNYMAMTRQDAPASLFQMGKAISSFYLERGQLSAVPDISEIIDPRFVSALYLEKGRTK
jgi:NitT/TauT family transport system substrate-binding protein